MILTFGGKIASNELDSRPKIVPWQPFAHVQKEIFSLLAEHTLPRSMRRFKIGCDSQDNVNQILTINSILTNDPNLKPNHIPNMGGINSFSNLDQPHYIRLQCQYSN